MLAEFGFTERAAAYVSSIKNLTTKCESAGWRYSPQYLSELEFFHKRLCPGDGGESKGIFGRIGSFFGGSKSAQPIEIKPHVQYVCWCAMPV